MRDTTINTSVRENGIVIPVSVLREIRSLLCEIKYGRVSVGECENIIDQYIGGDYQ